MKDHAYEVGVFFTLVSKMLISMERYVEDRLEPGTLKRINRERRAATSCEIKDWTHLDLILAYHDKPWQLAKLRLR